jgi:replicative superfamily II helicase
MEIRQINLNEAKISISNFQEDFGIQNSNISVDEVSILVAEGLCQGQQILVFCSSRSNCQFICKKLTNALQIIMSAWRGDLQPSVTHCKMNTIQLCDARNSIIVSLQNIYNDSAKVLNESSLQAVLLGGIRHGIAFHHAGINNLFVCVLFFRFHYRFIRQGA